MRNYEKDIDYIMKGVLIVSLLLLAATVMTFMNYFEDSRHNKNVKIFMNDDSLYEADFEFTNITLLVKPNHLTVLEEDRSTIFPKASIFKAEISPAK